MTPATRRLAPVLAVLTAALTVTACGDESGSEANPQTVTVTSSETVAPEVLDKPEQQQLSEKAAKDALPTLEDMPKGWLVNISPQNTKPSTYAPEVCAHVELDGAEARAFADKHLKVDERVHYSTDGISSDEHVFGTIKSYDAPYPLELFDKAGQHVPDCAEYEDTKGGRTTTWKTTPINPPALGDRAFGVRFSPSTIKGRNIDVLHVRSGMNLITVQLTTRSDSYDRERLGTYAQDILDHLAEEN